MAQDKFQSVAATFQIFKDGEAVSVRKLDGIIRKTQDGAEKIQRSLGDMGNRGLTFDGLPLFHNSIARAIGPADELTIAPIRVFDTPQNHLTSQNQGLVRVPYSTAVAVDVGNRSQNLLPIINQTDKIGVGCVNDDGSQCLQRFDSIYDQEKNILNNGLFTLQLSGWEVSGVIFDGDNARMDNVQRYNTLTYSEDFSQWTNVSGLLTERAFDNPDGATNATLFAPTDNGTNLVHLALSGTSTISSTDWCFSVYMASSGSEVTTFLEIDGANHIRGTQGRGGVDPSGLIYSVDISGTTWHRYYAYATFGAAMTSATARIHLGRGNLTDSSDGIYIWGAQLEPATGPSEYQPTSGTANNKYVGETFLGQTFSTIREKWYQVSLDFSTVSGTNYELYRNGAFQVSGSTNASITRTFKAKTDNTNLHLYVSGALGSEVSVSTFRVDPGTPCHALNCPGFSAYNRDRSYRATLPTLTDENNQYFGRQLKFPDTLDLATNPDLPANILGVFDHEQNQTVPNRLVNWRLIDWPIGQIAITKPVTDPEFLDDWTTLGTQTFPTEFNPISSGTTTRENTVVGLSDEFIPSTTDTDLELWLDGIQELSGYALNSGIVVWADKSSKARHFNHIGDIDRSPSSSTWPGHGDRRLAVMTNVNEYEMHHSGGIFTVTGDWTCAIVCNVDSGLQGTFGHTEADGAGADGFSTPRTVSWPNQIHYGGSTFSISEFNTGMNHSAGDLIVVVSRRDSSNDHYTYFNGFDFTQGTPTNNSSTLSVHGLFTVQDPSSSNAGAAIGEVILYSRDIGETNAINLSNYLINKWAITNSTSGLTVETPTDQVTVCASSGATEGIEKAFSLENNEIATWEYSIRGNLSYSGVTEIYTVSSGTASVDTDLTGIFTVVSGATNPLTNKYRVSGSIFPGEDNTWATFQNSYWNITRRIKSTSDNTWIRLGVGITGENASESDCVTIDRFNLLKQTATSSKFSYCGDSILGLNWDGRGDHIRDENLFQFSNNLLLWQNSGVVLTVDTESDEFVRISGTSGAIFQAISGADILDDRLTLTWQSYASQTTSGEVLVTQGSYQQQIPWTISSQSTSGIVIISGINHETGADMEVRWTLFGAEAVLGRPQLVHGSGIVDYIATSAEPIKKYRRAILPSNTTVDVSWAPGYALVEGGIIQTSQDGTTINANDTSWSVIDTRNFPAQGVVRIADQEFGYRSKASGVFADILPGWRGTNYNTTAIVSGSRVTNVPLPQPITAIDPITKEITFKNIIPAPLGDWNNSINLQIYNTHVSNLDRFSLQASAVPVTQAAGNLLTAFVQHVSDHRRHIRFSQLCNYIIDGSSWCASPFIIAQVELIDNTIQELDEQAQLNVEALRFVPGSSKEVIIQWGDGQETTVTGSKNKFTGITHIYDLRQFAQPKTYTITVVVKDLDLDFSRQATTSIIVRPKINPAGQPTKSTIRAGAKMLVQQTFATTAGAKIKDQNSSVTTAGAKMVLP